VFSGWVVKSECAKEERERFGSTTNDNNRSCIALRTKAYRECVSSLEERERERERKRKRERKRERERERVSFYLGAMSSDEQRA
jgi:hypothetical protein